MEFTSATKYGPSGLVAVALLALLSSGCGMVANGRNVDGVRYFQQGQYGVAMQRFQSALSADRTNADAYYNLAATYHRVGIQNKDSASLASAESLYRQCLDINPNHVDCRRAMAVLLTETNRTDEAFGMMRQWVATNPTLPDARVELARLHEEYGDSRTAETQLAESLQIDPTNWRAHAALGRLREQSGDYAQALSNYQRAYQLNQFQPQLAERITSLQRQATNVYGTGGAYSGTTTAGAPRPDMRY
jgi:tetratricopeptide (TPR) repeat protein